MRILCTFLFLSVFAFELSAQEASPSIGNPGRVDGLERPWALVPTLNSKGIDAKVLSADPAHPPLPRSGLSKSRDQEKSTRSSSGVSGYILNRQLVEQIARTYPPSGVEIGQGWNSFLNRASANLCIEGVVEKLPGTNLSASLSTVEDRSGYFNSISGSLGGSYGPFSGSGSYLKERRFSSYDANVVMNAIVDTGGRYIKPAPNNGIRLTDDALRLLKVKDGLDRFLQACGDSFVTAYREGGRMSAILSIANVNQEDKEDIQAKAAGGFGAFSASASFRKTVEASSSANSLKVTFEQIGGVFSGVPVTLDEMLARFTQYKVDEGFNPRPYVFFTQNYRSLPNWPEGLENRVSPVDQDFFVLSYYNFTDLGSDYDDAIKRPASFMNFLKGGSAKLKANRDEALTYARTLDLAVWECINAFDCSIEKLDEIDNDFQTLAKNRSGTANGVNPAQNAAEDSLTNGSFSGFVGLARGTIKQASASTGPATASEATNSEVIPGWEQLPADTVVLPKMTMSYYRSLAALPLYIRDGQTGFSIGLTADNQPPPDEEILRAFRNWLIASRLRPVAEEYCRRSANHPLCLSGGEMEYIVALLDIAPEPLRPTPAPVPAPPPPPPPPPPVVVAVPKKPHDPIERGPCRFNPSICF